MKTIALTKRTFFPHPISPGIKKRKAVSQTNYADLPIFHFATTISKQCNKAALRGAILGNFGAMNYGDEAILSGQLEELQKLKNCSITIIARFPQKIYHTHKTNAIHLMNVYAVLKTLVYNQFLIIGGGGIFCRNDAGLIGFLYQLYTILILGGAIILRKRVYILGVGMYKNMNPLLAKITILLLKKTDIITVRDEHSFNFLQIYIPTVKLYKDNSFLLPLLPKKTIEEESFFKTHYSRTRINIGIALKKPDTANETKKLLKAVIKFINEYASESDFWLYPMDSHSRYYNDLSFAKDIKSLSHKSNSIHIIPETWHPTTLFSSFTLMDYFISMRLHSSIFAYRTHVPFYAISYDKKCDSFLNAINKSFVTVSEISYSSLQESFNIVRKQIKRTITIRETSSISKRTVVRQPNKASMPVIISLRNTYDY